MAKLQVNIDSSIVLKAIEKSNPITVSGRVALENFKIFLRNHPLTPAQLEQSLFSLEHMHDVGLEGFISTLKGVMPTMKRKVAVAYELLQMEPEGSFLKAGIEAEEKLAELYQYNAAKIVKEIADGALDEYQTNPTIASLIAYAKAAYADSSANNVTPLMGISDGGGYKQSLVPILNIASLGDNGMLVCIDKYLFIRGTSGGFTTINDLSVLENVPAEVSTLLDVLREFKLDENNPNILVLNDSIASQMSKTLGIKSLKIDLLGPIDFVSINGEKMDTLKAKEILNANKDSIIANILTSESASSHVKFINSVLDIFEQYRGSIVSNAYARKFEDENKNCLYVVKTPSYYTAIGTMRDAVVSTTKYNTAYELLADSNVIVDKTLQNMIASVYATDLSEEVNSVSIRRKLLDKLTKEREEYERLLHDIEVEEREMDEVIDPNPEKVEGVKKLKKRITENLDKISDEIQKIIK